MLPNDDDAWTRFCGRLGALGERLLGDEFPSSDRDRAEGFAHLADQVAMFLGWAVRHADPYHPHFQRHNDLSGQWGGPNLDNVYKHARIDPSARDRITGSMHSCEDFILAVRVGFMHMPEWGALAELSASDLGIGPDDSFELFLGGEPRDRRWIDIPDGASMLSIREYYIDWQPLEPAVLTIECLDEPPAAAGLSSADLSRRLDDAGMLIERSIDYWNRYMVDARASAPPNEFGGGFKQDKGLAAALDDFCFFELANDEALVIEAEVPDAAYWSFHLYADAWFEVPDRETRITTRNHTQTAISDDGLIRLVVGGRDPGVANWIDTSDRRSGLVTFRWFWPRSERRPAVSTRVVAIDDVAATLPPDTPRIDPAGRAAEIARRRSHLAWRFHA